MRSARRNGLAVLLLAGLLQTGAGAARADGPGEGELRDLHYGETLFHFYQQDYFTAITKALAARASGRMQPHEEDAELLLGGMYLSFGQHRLAGEIFERMLADNVDAALADRVWYFLARIWYQRGYLEDAERALGMIGEPLPDELESERHMLTAQVLMAQGRFGDAAARLSEWKGPREWLGYARYNLGVALVRQGETEAGARLLEEVGSMRGVRPEQLGLRDKANVALGYAFLQAEQPELAVTPLRRVRLSGPYSNKALLGVGWADSARGRHREALTPWMELRSRDLLDPAVQESLLAIPYALARLDANRQAATHYLDAIEAFTEELNRIDGAIERIRGGSLLQGIAGETSAPGSGWYWELDELPDADETRYFYHLLAGHAFQESIKNYRDLAFMRENLDDWAESLTAFDDMLETQRIAYQQKLPAIEASLDQVDLEAMNARRVELEARISAIERENDVAGLATAKERALWDQLVEVERRLAALGDAPGAAPLAEKHRLLRGLLYWDLNRDYKARLWQQKKTLRELERAIAEAQRRRAVVERVREESPRRFAEYGARIAALEPRVDALRARLDGLMGRQAAHIQALAIEELEAQKARLDTYMVQARFALAGIYDRAAARLEAGAEDGEAP